MHMVAINNLSIKEVEIAIQLYWNLYVISFVNWNHFHFAPIIYSFYWIICVNGDFCLSQTRVWFVYHFSIVWIFPISMKLSNILVDFLCNKNIQIFLILLHNFWGLCVPCAAQTWIFKVWSGRRAILMENPIFHLGNPRLLFMGLFIYPRQFFFLHPNNPLKVACFMSLYATEYFADVICENILRGVELWQDFWELQPSNIIILLQIKQNSRFMAIDRVRINV